MWRHNPGAPIFQRLARKLREVLRFLPLSNGAADRRYLLVLALRHSRIISPAVADALTAGGHGVVEVHLTESGGEVIRIDLNEPSQVDSFIEIFVDRVYRLDRVCFSPDLVIDCGAFCGYFSAMATGRFPQARVVAIEANPRNHRSLQRQAELLTRAPELLLAAAHNRAGEILFAGAGMGGSVVDSAAPGAKEVPCFDFPLWLREQNPQRLVWKLDVEGAESVLLRGSLAAVPAQTVIFLETHFPDARCLELLDPYRAAGFTATEIRRRRALDGDYSYVEWELVRDYVAAASR